MACFKNGSIVELAVRESLSLQDVRGVTLRVTGGTVWITQEDDTQDVVLRAGDAWVVEKDGLTILEAQEAATLCAVGRRLDASVRLQPSTGATAWRRVHDAFAALFAAPAPRSVPYY